MLVSVSTLERLGSEIFAASRVTPAVRVNDTTDIWGPRGGLTRTSRRGRSEPLRSPARATIGCDLGLYSITFNNRVEDDLRSLEAFAASARRRSGAVCATSWRCSTPTWRRDSPPSRRPGHTSGTASCAPSRGSPGRSAPASSRSPTTARARCPSSAPTTPSSWSGSWAGRPAPTATRFTLLADAQRDGARVALFGRKIKLAESPLELVRHMRRVVDGEHSPEEARPGVPRGDPGGGPRAPAPARGGPPDYRAGPRAGGLSDGRGRASRMAERAAERSGILTFGSFITDHNLAIESYPTEDQATFITSRQLAAGGPGLQHRGEPAPPRPFHAGRVPGPPRRRRERPGGPGGARPARDLAGRDDPPRARRRRSTCRSWPRRRNGRRTFFCFRGCADLLDERHVDPSASRCRIFHVGAPGLHPRLDRPDPGGGNG